MIDNLYDNYYVNGQNRIGMSVKEVFDFQGYTKILFILLTLGHR